MTREVAPAVLQRALVEACDTTFNAITVDGECSTNDSVFALANGASGVVIGDGEYEALVEGLRAVCLELALGIVRGGEGATKLVSIHVTGAKTYDEAKRAARAIANSLLVKTAIHGADPNWGRLVAVAGRAGVAFSLSGARVRDRRDGAVRTRPSVRRARAASGGIPEGQGRPDRGQSRHGRTGRRDDLDVRPERGIRQDQRGISDVGRRTEDVEGRSGIFRTMAISKHALPSSAPRQFGSGFRARVTRSAPVSSSSSSARKPPKDFLSILDFEPEQIDEALRLAARMKQERRLGRRASTANALAALHVALIFEKPSLRTRATFEIAVRELGGDVIVPPTDVAGGSRETPADVARNLERWVAAVVIRTFAQERLQAFAAAAPKLHVINALSDEEHPCQGMADLLTLTELWGDVRGRTLAFIGDGNNVATSLVHAAMLSGLQHAHRLARRLRPAGARRGRRRARGAAWRDADAGARSERSGGERRRGLHGRVDVDGSGSGDGEPQSGVPAVSGERRPDGARAATTPSSCTASRRTAATR